MRLPFGGSRWSNPTHEHHSGGSSVKAGSWLVIESTPGPSEIRLFLISRMGTEKKGSPWFYVRDKDGMCLNRLVRLSITACQAGGIFHPSDEKKQSPTQNTQKNKMPPLLSPYFLTTTNTVSSHPDLSTLLAGLIPKVTHSQTPSRIWFTSA